MPEPARASEPPEAGTAFVGRQSIFDRHLGVFAYELLYRSGESAAADVVDGVAATSVVMIGGFIDIGLQRLVGGCPAFINFPRELLLLGRDLPIEADRVVLEILEDVTVDDALVRALSDLRRCGYTLALDDFQYAPRWEPLLGLAEYAKIDVQAVGLEGAREHAGLLAPRGLKLVAEKVETREEFDALVDMGYHYYQGYFLARPMIVRGRRIASSRLSLLQLVAALQDPATDAKRVEELVSRDAALSYKVLRYVNSAFYVLPREVTSIRKAVIYLGLDALKRLATLVSLSRIDDKPAELMRLALVRARMCERLGAITGASDAGAYFTTGLLSALDALMDAPLDSLVESLALSEALTSALLERTGPMGQALACALAYERCDWDEARLDELDPGTLADVYADAVAWSNEAWSTLAREPAEA